MEMRQDCSVGVYCITDALDKCESDSQQGLLHQIYQTFWGYGAVDSLSSCPHILITIYSYPEIGESLSRFRNRDLASYSVVRNDLKVMIQKKFRDLVERKKCFVYVVVFPPFSVVFCIDSRSIATF